MNMARASERDMQCAFDINRHLEQLISGYMPMEMAGEDDCEIFDLDDYESCRRALSTLIETAERASLGRVIWGMDCLLRAEGLLDPTSSILELHPELQHVMATMKEEREGKSSPAHRIYLSGPMTGLPDLNFPAFAAEAARLRAAGWDVVNPAEIAQASQADWHACMRNDIAELVRCDSIALLPGWMNSQGAMLELQIAHRLGLKVVMAAELGARPEAA